MARVKLTQWGQSVIIIDGVRLFAYVQSKSNQAKNSYLYSTTKYRQNKTKKMYDVPRTDCDMNFANLILIASRVMQIKRKLHIIYS